MVLHAHLIQWLAAALADPAGTVAGLTDDPRVHTSRVQTSGALAGGALDAVLWLAHCEISLSTAVAR